MNRRLAGGIIADTGGDSQAGSPLWGRAWTALKLAQVRLRIPLVLVAAALVVGRWDWIRNYWDYLTRGTLSESIAHHAISADTEYFCPMDPGVLSDWPAKCGICNMALVRRKKGEAIALPDGVIARMQLSPYRVQLAGIQTAPAAFLPLSHMVEASGVVTAGADSRSVLVEVPARQAPWIAVGQAAEIVCADLAGRGALKGTVHAVDRRSTGGWEYLAISIQVIDPPRALTGGMIAVVRLEIPVAALEPFCMLPSDPPTLVPGEARIAYACPDHPQEIAPSAGRCPIDRQPRVGRPLSNLERLRWWCPMHANVTADRPGSKCEACGGMILKPRVIAYRPAGEVLTVPASAVIDGGQRKVVFVETMPGMFDGVEVVLGPRCGDLYPVVRGVEVGQRVAVAGAFLLDAETRLNPALAAAYFGAGRGERVAAVPPSASAVKPDAPPVPGEFPELSPEDRTLAQRQRLCPVTDKPLGSMGTPIRIVVSGQVVFLCCAGCEGALKGDPSKYLAKLSGH